MNNITAEQAEAIIKARHRDTMPHKTLNYQRIADMANEDLSRKHEHHWLDWSMQEIGARVVYKMEEYVLTEPQNNGFYLDGNYYSVDCTEYLKPDLTKRGYWVVNPDSPLTEKPVGLSDAALIAIKYADHWVLRHSTDAIEWPRITSFMILEP